MGLLGFGRATFNGTLRHYLGLFIPGERVFGLYVVSMVVMAWLVWRSNRRNGRETRGFFAYAFDGNVYRHKSARQDYLYFLANGFIYYGLIAQFMCSEWPFAMLVYNGLTRAFGSLSTPLIGGVASKILFTVAAALLFDLATFLLHYAMHKMSVLWPFHKIHHSAEVLTPVTLFRMHPVDLFISSAAVVAFTGAGIGLFGYLSGKPVAGFEVFGVNVIVFLFYLTGYNLRHSQIWLSYPKWMSHVLVSPAQHQVHHSTAPQHKDKNFGLIFAFWDALLGTLYVPEAYEGIEYGVTREDRNPYGSIASLFVKPFTESAGAARALMKRGAVKESAVLLAAVIGCYLCFREIKALGAGRDVVPPSVYMEDLTWPEIHVAVRNGYTTAIVASGGTEQNGPHMVLGKHNLVVRYAAGEIAKRLGGTLVAPVIPYVPEGDIGPPATGNMPWDGTMGVPDQVLEELLYWAAIDLRWQGFKHIFFIGDHGLSQKAQQEVAQALASWQTDGVTVASIGDYYAENGQVEWLKKRGFSDEEIGSHASVRDTSEVMYLQPSGIRQTPVTIPDVPDGITGNPVRASKEIGKTMIELKIAAGSAQMQRIRAAGTR
jgi:sterol desaturase/sphingolipid hydroxylase (fatty acid hydroxylase superfamily)/creatinine amidohydrolase/Fe(II)-dependent formamide hydrolase-like protein